VNIPQESRFAFLPLKRKKMERFVILSEYTTGVQICIPTFKKEENGREGNK
jgi:hypothetical protein